MKMRILFLLVWLPLLSAAQPDYVAGQLIIQLRHGAELSGRRTLPDDSSLHHIEVLSLRFGIHLYACTPGKEQGLIDRFSKHPEVMAIQLNHKVQLRDKTPNDPLFSQQWALMNTGQNGGIQGADISATAAWAINTGGKNSRGDQVVVAVIDEGFQLDHPDLENVFFKNAGEVPGNGIDDDGNGYTDDVQGWNAYQNSGNIPLSSHGTHVCGIIAARGDNAQGIAGINWNLKILPVAGSSENEAKVIAAYGYVAEMRALYNATNGRRGAFVVATNASFGVNQGKPEQFPIWCALYDSLGQHGILNVAATTNSNINVDLNGDIPTACPSEYLIAVTNSMNNDEKNPAAGFGVEHIDIAAPGTGIYSTNAGSAYGYRTGTSMASPMVAGALGLMYSEACGEFTEYYRQHPAEGASTVRQLLLDGADRPGTLNGLVAEGRRLDLEKPLKSLGDMPCNPALKPRAAFSSSYSTICQGDSIQFFNQSSAPYDLLLWEFPGGSIASSVLQNPVVYYERSGVFAVSLVIGGANQFDTAKVAQWVTVMSGDNCPLIHPAKPIARFSTLSSDLCQGQRLQLINNSSNATEFQWFVNQTQEFDEINPAIQVMQSGAFSIRMIAKAENTADTLDTVIVVRWLPQREIPLIAFSGNKLYTLSQGPLQWYLNEKILEGQVGNFIIPEKAGYYRVEVSNSWGCTQISEPWPYGFTGENNIAREERSFYVGPVPAGDRLNIFSYSNEPFGLQLFDVSGRVILSEQFKGGHRHTLDFTGITSGFYYLHLYTAGRLHPEIIRIIKQTGE